MESWNTKNRFHLDWPTQTARWSFARMDHPFLPCGATSVSEDTSHPCPQKTVTRFT